MKPFTTDEISQLERIMTTLEHQAKCDYANRSGKFAHAKLIDADDDLFVLELRSGIQDDTTNRVHTDIIIASRTKPGIIFREYEEEVLLCDEEVNYA